MNHQWPRSGRAAISMLAIAGASMLAFPAVAQHDLGYRPIDPTEADKTITLTGHDMTIEQVIEVARGGAKVQLSAEARQREIDNYGLLLEAPAEGVSVYWFTRGAGAGREVKQFEGDPLSPENKELLEKKMLASFRRGAANPLEGPEIADEALVRAVMAVRANAMTFNAPSPQLAQMLIDLLNRRVTPVMQSRGTVGEGDLSVLANIAATLAGSAMPIIRHAHVGARRVEGGRPAPLNPSPRTTTLSSAATPTPLRGRVRRGRRKAGARLGGPHLCDRLERHEQLRHAPQLSGADRPSVQMAELGRRPGQGDDQGELPVQRRQGPDHSGPGEPACLLDPSSVRVAMWAMLRDDVVTQLNSSDHNPAIRAASRPRTPGS